ncbi:MAG TPA: hypothetical protein VF625_12540 [Longimicrobium sp.]
MKDIEPPQPETAGDYFVVVTRYDSYYVTAETAREVGRALDRWMQPRWLKFVDLAGARAWIRAEAVTAVHESTEHARTRDRTFSYALRREARAETRWDDDDM